MPLAQLIAAGFKAADGTNLASGKVYHYEAGTTTLKDMYITVDGDPSPVAAAQPIILDSRGTAVVYGSGVYDIVITDSADGVIQTIAGLDLGAAYGWLTAAQLLTLIKTVDGAGSGLDADLLDGNHAAAFLLAAAYTAADVLAKIKTVDGTGSGLDADLLDGSHSTAFATAAQGILADNALPAASYTAADVLAKLLTVDGAGSGLDADKLDGKHLSEVMADIAALGYTKVLYRDIVQAINTDYVVASNERWIIFGLYSFWGYNREGFVGTSIAMVELTTGTWRLDTYSEVVGGAHPKFTSGATGVSIVPISGIPGAGWGINWKFALCIGN